MRAQKAMDFKVLGCELVIDKKILQTDVSNMAVKLVEANNALERIQKLEKEVQIERLENNVLNKKVQKWKTKSIKRGAAVKHMSKMKAVLCKDLMQAEEVM